MNVLARGISDNIYIIPLGHVIIQVFVLGQKMLGTSILLKNPSINILQHNYDPNFTFSLYTATSKNDYCFENLLWYWILAQGLRNWKIGNHKKSYWRDIQSQQ